MKMKYLSLPLFLCLINTLTYSQTVDVRKNALRTTFLSYATGSTKLSYERSVSTHQSVEVTAGVIGVGYDGKNNHPRGGLFRCAYKYIFNATANYPLNGIYFKSEFALSSFNYDAMQKNSANETIRQNSTMGALLACAGYQWAKHVFTVDGFVGLGGALGKECDTYYHHGFILWDFFGTKCKYVSCTFGVKLGIAFGKH